MRHWVTRAVVAVMIAGGVVAQQPAPAAETAAPDLIRQWGPEDAAAWNWLAQASSVLRANKPLRGGESAALAALPATHRLAVHAATETGFGGEPQELSPEAKWVLFAFPTRGSTDARHVFCLVSDGRLFAAANSPGYREADAPEPTAATGRGSKGRFEDLLRGPGNGADGQFWQPSEMFAPQRRAVSVADENGRPVARGRVAFVPTAALRQLRVPNRGEEPCAFAVPATDAQLDDEGNGVLRGIASEGLVACVEHAGMWIALPPDAVAEDGAALRLTLDVGALQRARANANESAAIATLKNISSAQAQCQACGVVDANKNGAGEYGFFAELAGAVGVRTDGDGGIGGQKISPPVLSTAFGRVQGSCVVRSGYVFAIFLPGKDSSAIAENESGGGSGRTVDPARAEVLWCCYAWPVDPGVSGRRAFFVNQAGDVLACDNADGRYAGAAKRPAPGAAFLAGGTGRLDSALAAHQVGIDGQRWTVVN